MRAHRHAIRALAYAWAAPTTLVGLAAGALTLATGGHVQRRRGCLEFHGGFSRWLGEAGYLRWLGQNRVARWLGRIKFHGFGAMTLGHVIIARDGRYLESCRDHEQAHVRQAEKWGPAFIPAYLIASVWAWKQGRHYYLDNWFERDARRACGEGW